jgi:hypothetical protein
LFERALLGGLIRTPPHELGAMTKTIASDMVKPDLHYEFGPDCLPISAALSAPAARAAGRLARKAWAAPQFFELPR